LACACAEVANMVPKAAKTVAANFNLMNFIQFSPIKKLDE
jgi:hypothetical protein